MSKEKHIFALWESIWFLTSLNFNGIHTHTHSHSAVSVTHFSTIVLVTGSAGGMFSPVPHHTTSLVLKDRRRSEMVPNLQAEHSEAIHVHLNSIRPRLIWGKCRECQRITAAWSDSSPLAAARVTRVHFWALRNHLMFEEFRSPGRRPLLDI